MIELKVFYLSNYDDFLRIENKYRRIYMVFILMGSLFIVLSLINWILSKILKEKLSIYLLICTSAYGLLNILYFGTDFECNWNLIQYRVDKLPEYFILEFSIIFYFLVDTFIIVFLLGLFFYFICVMIKRKQNKSFKSSFVIGAAYIFQSISASIVITLFIMSFIDITVYEKINVNIYNQIFNFLLAVMVPLLFSLFKNLQDQIHLFKKQDD